MTAPHPTVERRAVDAVRTILGLGGLLALVVGILILVNPLKSGAVAMQIIAVIVAIYMIGVGAVSLGTSLFSRSLGGWARTGNILLGVLYLVAGVVLIANLTGTAVLLTWLLVLFLGAMWIFEGVLAFTMMKSSGRPAWSVFYGIVSIIAGLVLIFSPGLSALALWVLLGASMIVMGIIQMVRAFSIRVD